MKQALIIALVGTTLGGCAIERAHVAQQAQKTMVGKTKEQVLACMGVPAAKASEGATEVWSYNSGNGMTVGAGSSNVSVWGGGGYASGYGSSSFVTQRRFCTVNMTMTNGTVERVNYVGPTGGLLTQGEQCAYVLENCLK